MIDGLGMLKSGKEHTVNAVERDGFHSIASKGMVLRDITRPEANALNAGFRLGAEEDNGMPVLVGTDAVIPEDLQEVAGSCPPDVVEVCS